MRKCLRTTRKVLLAIKKANDRILGTDSESKGLLNLTLPKREKKTNTANKVLENYERHAQMKLKLNLELL